MLNKQGRKRIIYWVILGCAVFMRIIAFIGSDNFHGIAAGKIMEAKRILEHPHELTAWIVPAHGPAHLYLVALGLKLSNNHYNSAVFLSLLFGIGVLLPYIGFVKSAFDDKTAICSSFLIAFFPLHIIYSVLSTAETMFLFFLFSGLLFFVREQKTGRLIDLLFSALFLSIATVCRFEGGLFIIIIMTMLLIKNRRKAFFFVLISSVLPIDWMWGNYLVSGNFMQFLFASDAIVKEGFARNRALGLNFGAFQKIFYWIIQIKSYFGLPILIGGLCALILYGFKKEYRKTTFLLIIPLAYFSYKTFIEELAMQPRYGMSLGMLLIPYFSMLLANILKQVKMNLRKTVFLTFIIYVVFRCAYLQLIMLPHSPVWVKEAALFLRNNTSIQDAIYIESKEDNIKEPLKVYSGLKAEQFIDYTPFSNNVEMLNPDGMEKLKFIVMVSNQRLKNREEIFKINNCRIYQVKKNAE
ncbi:MAG: glycosyltransferase family 39 protein [Candidatus Omnitrophota bacterium]